jgi:hypothetical protein
MSVVSTRQQRRCHLHCIELGPIRQKTVPSCRVHNIKRYLELSAYNTIAFVAPDPLAGPGPILWPYRLRQNNWPIPIPAPAGIDILSPSP